LVGSAMRFEGLGSWFDHVTVGTSVVDLRDGWQCFEGAGAVPFDVFARELRLELRVARDGELEVLVPLEYDESFVDTIALVDESSRFVFFDDAPYTEEATGGLSVDLDPAPAGLFRLHARVVDASARAWIVDQEVRVAAGERTVVVAELREGAAVDALLPRFERGSKFARLAA